jgi:hypothetical protein
MFNPHVAGSPHSFSNDEIEISRSLSNHDTFQRGQYDAHDSPLSSLAALRKAQLSLADSESFRTARASIASYATASSILSSRSDSAYVRGTIQLNRLGQTSKTKTDATLPSNLKPEPYEFRELVKAVVARVLVFHNETAPALTLPDQAMFRSWVYRSLEP